MAVDHLVDFLLILIDDVHVGVLSVCGKVEDLLHFECAAVVIFSCRNEGGHFVGKLLRVFGSISWCCDNYWNMLNSKEEKEENERKRERKRERDQEKEREKRRKMWETFWGNAFDKVRSEFVNAFLAQHLLILFANGALRDRACVLHCVWDLLWWRLWCDRRKMRVCGEKERERERERGIFTSSPSWSFSRFLLGFSFFFSFFSFL